MAQASRQESTDSIAVTSGALDQAEATEEMDSEARKKRFSDYWHYRDITLEEMISPEFALGQNDDVTSLRVITGLWGLTAQDLREVYAETEDKELRAWAIMGACFGKELDSESLAWMEDLSTQGVGEPGLEQVAAVYAAREASGFQKLSDSEAMQRISSRLLEQAKLSGASSVESNAALALALQATENLGADLSAKQLEDIALSEGTSSELAGQCYEVLARTGGADGAQAVIGAALRGDPGALEGVRALHDESAIPELLTWIDSIGTDDGDDKLGSAAIRGLLSTGTDTAVEKFEALIIGDDRLSPEQNAKRQEMAIEALGQLTDLRCMGLESKIRTLSNSLRSDPADTDSVQLSWKLHNAMKTQGFLQTSVMFTPSKEVMAEIAINVRDALRTVPSGSLEEGYLWWDMVKYAREEDIGFIEANAPPLAYQKIKNELERVKARYGRASLQR